MKRIQRPLLLLALFTAPMALTACETMRGAGKDIEHAGESVAEFTDDVADEIED